MNFNCFNHFSLQLLTSFTNLITYNFIYLYLFLFFSYISLFCAYLSSSTSLWAKVQLPERGQDPLKAKSLHILTLYLMTGPTGPDPEPGPVDPPPSCDFRLLPPPLPCWRTKSTNAATTILTASRAARQFARLGGSASANKYKYFNINKYIYFF